MNRIGRVGILASVGIIGVGLVSGCGGATAAGSAPSSMPAAPTSVLQLRFPIAAYELTVPQSAQVRYLEERLTQVCMRSFGFDYLPLLSTSVIATTARAMDEASTRLYGVSDAAAARAYGYHPPPWLTGTTTSQTIGGLPLAERAVLTGQGVKSYDGRSVPDGGCLNQAANELLRAGVGVDAQQSRSSGTLPSAIDASAFQSAQSDPHVLAVFARWSSCMRSYGYRYATPFDAGADPRWLSATAASPVEIQTAERDIDCKLRVNLLGVEYRVESGYENTAIAKNAAALADVANQLPAEAAAIDRLTAQYGG
jgi:hypothetical protein